MNIRQKYLLIIGGSFSLILLVTCWLIFWNNNKIILHQSLDIANIIATQVRVDRAEYTKSVVKKLKKELPGFGVSIDYLKMKGHAPLPAVFISNIARRVAEIKGDLYSYSLTSKWNLNPTQGLNDDFEMEGFDYLLRQEEDIRDKGGDPLTHEWKPFFRVEMVGGKKTLRFLSPDLASVQACVSCHNRHEEDANTLKMRRSAGITTQKEFKLGSLMGALSINIPIEEAGAFARSNSMKIISIIVVMVIICGILTLMLSNTICRKLEDVADRMRDVALGEGDLTRRFEISARDEIGILCENFNIFMEKLHGIISKIAEITDIVASASAQIAASSEQMSKGAVRQSDQTIGVVTAMDQMAGATTQVAENALEAAGDAEKASKVAGQGREVVLNASGEMKNIATAVYNTAETIRKLGKRSDEIRQIIGVIDDIADQTNLLALNAAIEAARAGEQGRGFAVVADEVRKLAIRTTSATKEIETTIKEIVKETQDAVVYIGKETAKAEEGTKLAEKAGDSIGDILKNAEDVVNVVHQIATAAEEQSATAREIAGNLEGISGITSETLSGTKETATAANDLSKQVESLQALVKQFKLK